ncbi:asparagine synthase-related protein [Streptomyces sp. NPDC050355]|uniref:asparagine synthase-related protein n=1 Tax=Streptomyces sp. NPDC050355 TaxID=3365609 RepID=UPI0037A0CD58
MGAFPATDGQAVARFRGRPRDGEVRGVDLPRGSVTVIGQCFADDGRLRSEAARALRNGDPSALTRLPGAYACLVLRDGELLLLEDVAGQYPFYYRYSGGQLWFGDRPAAVAEAAGIECRADTGVLAALILCPGVPALIGDSSPVEGIRRLGGGHALHINARGTLRRWAYEPLSAADPGSTARTIGGIEAAEAVRQSLDDAVHVRADRADRLTTDFSGGLDSTSLAFLTLAHRPGELEAFVYHRPGSPCDDLPYAERYARLNPRLRLETVTGGIGELSFQGLDQSGFTEVAQPGAATRARTRLRLRHIASRGGGLHLGGEGGDALFAAPAAYLADLVRPGSLRRLRGDSWALARMRNVSPNSVLAAAVRLSRTPMDNALRQLADRLERPGEREVSWLDTIAWWPEPGREALWLTSSARRNLVELAARRADAVQGRPSLSAAEQWTLCELHASAAMQRYLSDCAREFDVWPQAPFLDHGVIRACLALPASLRAGPPAPKPLLTTSLAGAVPPEVLARRTKGDYSSEDYAGARTASPALRALITSSRLAELGVIEPASVSASLDRAAMGVGAPFAALTRLLGVEAGLRAMCDGHERGDLP